MLAPASAFPPEPPPAPAVRGRRHAPPPLAEALRLLEAGCSRPETARRTGLSEAAVRQLALCGREDPEGRPPEPLPRELLTARRCPGCGGLVCEWPCLACRLRKAGEALNAER